MKQKICLLTLVALLFFQFSTTNAVEAETSCQQNVFVSEIGWVGSSKNAADEWLELANIGETTFEISGWTIEGAGTNGSSLTLPEGATIPSRSTYLIANYSSESASSTLAAPPNYITTAVSLSNSSLQLILKDQNGCQIDEAGDGGAPFFGGTGTAGTISMVRREPLTPGNQSTSWTATETSKGFDSDASDKGTPGSIEWISFLSSATEEVESSETSEQPPPLSSPTVAVREEESTEIEIEDEAVVEENISSEIIDDSATEESTDTTTTEEIISEEITSDEETEDKTVSETEIEDTETEVNPPPLSSPTAPQLDSGRPEESKAAAVREEETTTVSYSIETLLINEFVSDPVSGEKEWVEVINPNNTTIDLTDWKISEASGRTAALPEIQLGYGQVAVAEFSSSALHNDSDQIKILAPDGTVVDEIEYGTTSIPTIVDPNSVARGANGNFLVTETPTKGTMNVITTTVTVTKTEKCDTTKKMAESIDSEASLKTFVEKEETTKTTVVETTPPTLRLSEIYPNTDGSDATDEFIELENFGSETIDLFGVTLKDAAENNWIFSDHRELAAGKFLSVSRTEYKFALNNSGSETVSLYSAGGTLLDQTQYENAPKNSTYARNNELWNWTSIITPNEPNSFQETLESEDSGLVRQNDTNADLNIAGVTAPESVVASVTVAEARTLTKDSQVMVTGIVSVEPNVFGRQIFYLTDNVAGIQIYKSDGNFPELVVGDAVEISGTVSFNRSEPRIKISPDDEIFVIESGVTLEIADTKTINEAEAGQLVRLAGMVTEKSSQQLTIETAGGLSEIRIKENTGIDLSKLEPGSNLTVKGIVGQSADKYFLLPRSPDDIVIEKKEETTAPIVSTEPTGKQVVAKTDQKKAIIIGLTVIVGLIIYAIQKRRGLKTKSYEKTSKLAFAGTG